MNYQQSIRHEGTNQLLSYSSKNLQNDLRFDFIKKLSQKSELLPYSQDESKKLNCIDKINSSNNISKQFKTLIKINKNIQNAFPSNFFNNYKSERLRNQQRNDRNSFKINLEQRNSNQNSNQSSIEKLNRYIQTHQEKRSNCHLNQQNQVSQFDLSSKQINRRFKVKKIYSCKTSLEKGFKKTQFNSKQLCKDQKNIRLPQTAETLNNGDEIQQDLLNITFGNGLNNQKNQNQSISFLNNSFSKKNCKQQLEPLDSLRLKNIYSLELKNYKQKQQIQKRVSQKNNDKKQVQSERRHNPSQRKGLFSLQRQTEIEQSNPFDVFQKIKLDMREILNKKTVTLPKMKNFLEQNENKRVNAKKTKLVF